ncbi:MAG: hypothetical protein KBS75_07055 [Bacteroidales bacterium]|nr:hypothetical protein [Candidatus Equimonas faecalis]
MWVPFKERGKGSLGSCRIPMGCFKPAYASSHCGRRSAALMAGYLCGLPNGRLTSPQDG